LFESRSALVVKRRANVATRRGLKKARSHIVEIGAGIECSHAQGLVDSARGRNGGALAVHLSNAHPASGLTNSLNN
jgi:hypothetical protein